MDTSSAFMQYVAPLLVTGLFGLITFALKMLADKWAAEGKSNKLIAVGAKVAHFAELVVADLDANLKPQLQSALADGVITPEEQKALRDLALARMKLLLAKEGMAELTGVLGIATSQVDSYILGAIEKAVTTKNHAASF